VKKIELGGRRLNWHLALKRLETGKGARQHAKREHIKELKGK